MGAAWSSYRLKRKEKALYKKLFKKQSRCFLGPMCVPETIQVKNITAQVEEEIRALSDKLQLDEKALNKTSSRERCSRELEKNFSLLQENEGYLQQQNSLRNKRLSDWNLKRQACQFAHFQNTHPLEKWTVCSLPELYHLEL